MIEILPRDLREFLAKAKPLEYDVEECEAGRVTLKRLEDLCIEPIYIDSENSPLELSDPNMGRKGYYEVPAVSLLATCEYFDPEGILVWLPNQSSYGTWDNDHWDVLIFPNASWTDIVKDPMPFINAQWKHGVAFEYLAPWDRYSFNEGRPW